MKNDKEKKQIRKTRHDSLSAQKKMRKIVKTKIKDGTGLSEKELEDWDITIADALMSWGKTTKVYYDLPSVRISFGSVHTFALKMMDYTNPVKIKYEGNIYTFQIKILWELLYKYMLDVFPCALDEALHISKEAEEREEWSGYDFSAKKEVV